METPWLGSVAGQLGASLDSLEGAIVACPEDLWSDRTRQPEVFYLVYHTLFFLDYYFSLTPEGFAPPPPFNLDELDPSGILPERVYTKAEMLTYLAYGRAKAARVIAGLDDEKAHRRTGFERPETSVAELILFNTRHVQHHTAQVNLLIRQAGGTPAAWVVRGSLAPPR
jgi:hypothetical protein